MSLAAGHSPFFYSHPGAFDRLICPHPGEFAIFLKNMPMPGIGPVGGCVLLELTDALTNQSLLPLHRFGSVQKSFTQTLFGIKTPWTTDSLPCRATNCLFHKTPPARSFEAGAT